MQTGKIIAACLLLLLPSIAAAADKAFTVYGGYRDGGHFTDADTDQSLDLEGSGAISLALDFAKDAARAYQVFLSYQRTDLSFENSSSASSDSVDMDVTYLHIGGTNFWQGTLGKGPYVVGGLGVTFYDPGAGYDNELRPSLNLGLGYEQPLSKRFSLRFEARGYATFVNSSGGFFCSGGCVVSISADVIGQWEVMMGLSAHF